MLYQTLSPAAATPTANLFPVVRELPAELDTPISAYLKLAGKGPSFLLESVTGGEHLSRYSFIGVNPSRAFILRGRELEERSAEGVSLTSLTGDPFSALRQVLAPYHLEAQPGLPRFAGGLAGYLGFDIAAQIEPAIPGAAQAFGQQDPAPDALFLLADTLVAFDHAFGRMLLIANTPFDGSEEEARRRAQPVLDDLEERLAGGLPPLHPTSDRPRPSTLRSNTSYPEFVRAVERAKGHIAAGDIFQVVLSQRFSRTFHAEPFSIYRALRRLNPSPYMFYFDFGNLAGPPLRLIGASPELHVRLEGRQAALRPIAGTRTRGRTAAEDQALQAELLADPKERAEHVMLVDLARNDLGRVSAFGSVHTPELMSVEQYSHVMHIVSQVEGQLEPGLDGFDLMRATFPAGTVSGAPKIRAMQIISELEKSPRGPYAGAVGYFSYDGSLDTCITIRTLVMQGNTVHIQAGAGIVADSDPEREYHETLNKARALAVAVEQAENVNNGGSHAGSHR